MIQPSIGRVVWYRPNLATDGNLARNSVDQPFAAIVAFVYSAELVNLVVFDHRGTPHNRAGVRLAQDREAAPGECEWMPYQKAVAANVAEAQLKAQVEAQA